MPCNGVTIARLEFNQLVETMLQDNPQMVRDRIKALISREFGVEINPSGISDIGIRGNEVTLVTYNRSLSNFEEIQERVNEFVNSLAGYYQQKLIIEYFESRFKITKPARDPQGAKSFYINFPLKAKVKISTTGKVEIITQEGNFEEGKTAIEALISKLNQTGFNASLASPYEQHRHEASAQHQTLKNI